MTKIVEWDVSCRESLSFPSWLDGVLTQDPGQCQIVYS